MFHRPYPRYGVSTYAFSFFPVNFFIGTIVSVHIRLRIPPLYVREIPTAESSHGHSPHDTSTREVRRGIPENAISANEASLCRKFYSFLPLKSISDESITSAVVANAAGRCRE